MENVSIDMPITTFYHVTTLSISTGIYVINMHGHYPIWQGDVCGNRFVLLDARQGIHETCIAIYLKRYRQQAADQLLMISHRDDRSLAYHV